MNDRRADARGGTGDPTGERRPYGGLDPALDDGAGRIPAGDDGASVIPAGDDGASVIPAGGDGAGGIRVVFVDYHVLFRQGLTALLTAAEETAVVGEAGTGTDAVTVVDDVGPDVVLMDIQMPEMNGIEATRRIVDDHPDTRVVMLTMLEDDDSLFAAMCAGARGYLLKGADKDDVLRTVRAAAAGEARFGPAIARRLTAFFKRADHQGLAVTPFAELTDREREVLDLVARGLDNSSIASRLFISGKTVSNHLSNIFTKLRVADRAQAIVKAREAGLGHEVGEGRAPG
jgi:DNA-binding NarL/FixJ family response regulator